MLSDPPGRFGRKGRGQGRRRRRMGRPRVQPQVFFNWHQVKGETILALSKEELEALRLVDEENLTQEEAADKMGISRGTVWRLINGARKKIIQALGTGHSINLRVIRQDEGTE